MAKRDIDTLLKMPPEQSSKKEHLSGVAVLDGDLNQRLAGLVVLVVGLVALAHAAADARLALLWFRATALPSHLHGHELSSDKCPPTIVWAQLPHDDLYSVVDSEVCFKVNGLSQKISCKYQYCTRINTNIHVQYQCCPTFNTNIIPCPIPKILPA